MNKSRRLSITVLSVILLSAVAVFLFIGEKSKDYPSFQKSSVMMGTVVTQKLYSAEAEKHIEKANEIIAALDSTISWRQKDSALAALNSTGSVDNSTIAEALGCLEDISRLSEGAFDVTIGRVSQLWSIGEDNQRVPSEREIEELIKDVDYKALKIENSLVTLSGNAHVDLGAVGKGYACDLVKKYLDENKIDGAIISVGGSILAYGNFNEAGDKWNIAVQHPRDGNEYLGILSVDEGFISTSGDYERYFEKDGRRYHHIIDANTGHPSSSDAISVTVVCDSGIISDALSTACFILGYEKSLELLKKYNASAIFVDRELNVKTVGELDFEIL